MKSPIALKVLLALAGVLALAIGASILVSPDAFYAELEFPLSENVNLKNELRASGGGVLASGFLILLGTRSPRFAFTSTLVAGGLYLSYGAARVASWLLDGVPHGTLVVAACVELVLGAACVVAYWLLPRPPRQDA